MKKVLLTSGALALLLSAAGAKAEPFNGWNVGLFAGWQRTKTEGEVEEVKKNVSFNGIPLGVFAGWAKSSPQSLYGGFDVSLGYGGVSGTKNIIDGRASGTPITAGVLSYKQTRKFFIEATPKLGWNFGGTVAYVLLGLRGTQVEHETKVEKNLMSGAVLALAAGERTQAKGFMLSVAPGLGFEHKFNEHVSAGLEYRYIIEGKKEWEDRFRDEISSSNKMHDIRVRLVYAF